MPCRNAPGQDGFLVITWNSLVNEGVCIMTMRSTNLHFTYLLTYIMKPVVRESVKVFLSCWNRSGILYTVSSSSSSSST